MALVHIVLAVYNGERYLREQLDSLLSQTCRDFFVEVCDDGSTDSTRDIVREYQSRDARISLHINEKNQGYVRNFLEGVKRSRSPYIMLCDQDDIWNPDKIERTLSAMKARECQEGGKPVLVFTDAMNFDSDTGEDRGRFHENSHLDTKKVDTAHLFMENKCIGCTVMCNRQILGYLKELPEGIRVHDWWLALICSHFGEIVYLDEPTLRYRQHGANVIGGSSFWDYVQKRLGAIRDQRRALYDTYHQAEVFLSVFRREMTEEQILLAERFAGLGRQNWFGRRVTVCRFGFLKSGITRNLGLFLLM